MAFFLFRRPATKEAPPSRADAFSTEMLGHMDTLFSVASRMTRGSSEAEDLVQDTILKAIRAKDQFEPGTNLKAWLLRILTNTFINKYRRGGMERGVLDGPTADTLVENWTSASTMRAVRDAESAALKPLIEAELSAALDELPEDFRLAVILSDVEELSYKEIADVMGCPIGTVMSRLHRGRKLLQSRLRDHAEVLGILPAQTTSRPAQESSPEISAPADLAAFRERRRAVS
jgi:RNA polymerase sigma-70 factor (ECF subfamily)